MLRIAAAEDLTALTRLRRAATGDSAEDAAGWLQRVAGLENILLLEKPGAPPALMLAAVPVHYAHRKGIWFTGLAANKGVPADKLLPKLLEGALRAFAENGCDFAVMTPDTAADASHLADLGFKNLLPLRVVSKPIRRNLLAQAQFDSLTVRHLMERRLRARLHHSAGDCHERDDDSSVPPRPDRCVRPARLRSLLHQRRYFAVY